jgi:hypothetical protein
MRWHPSDEIVEPKGMANAVNIWAFAQLIAHKNVSGDACPA